LGASLTEIGLLSEFAGREETPPQQVKEDVAKIATKAQSSTRALDQIVWAVNPRNDTVEGFVTYACAYAQEQLNLGGIQCRLDAPSPLPGQALAADVRHHLFMAFKEALNNIVKHARATLARISITTVAGSLSVLIEDDGCGFDHASAASPRGNGLGGMRERLRLIGGDFECQSKRGAGTRIKLTVQIEEIGMILRK
jgi:signal transduction histidine kinase